MDTLTLDSLRTTGDEDPEICLFELSYPRLLSDEDADDGEGVRFKLVGDGDAAVVRCVWREFPPARP